MLICTVSSSPHCPPFTEKGEPVGRESKIHRNLRDRFQDLDPELAIIFSLSPDDLVGSSVRAEGTRWRIVRKPSQGRIPNA